jgi:hypothetical protein
LVVLVLFGFGISFILFLFLFDHAYYASWALMCTDSTALTIIQIGFEIAFFIFMDTRFRTVDIA